MSACFIHQTFRVTGVSVTQFSPLSVFSAAGFDSGSAAEPELDDGGVLESLELPSPDEGFPAHALSSMAMLSSRLTTASFLFFIVLSSIFF